MPYIYGICGFLRALYRTELDVEWMCACYTMCMARQAAGKWREECEEERALYSNFWSTFSFSDVEINSNVTKFPPAEIVLDPEP